MDACFCLFYFTAYTLKLPVSLLFWPNSSSHSSPVCNQPVTYGLTGSLPAPQGLHFEIQYTIILVFIECWSQTVQLCFTYFIIVELKK